MRDEMAVKRRELIRVSVKLATMRRNGQSASLAYARWQKERNVLRQSLQRMAKGKAA